MLVLRVVVDRYAQELCRLNKTVHADGQVLTVDIDKARVEEREHALFEQVLEVLVVRQLHLMHQVHHLLDISLIGHALAHCILDGAVQVDSQHTLRTRTDTAGTQRVTEAVVGNLVTQTAARGQ